MKTEWQMCWAMIGVLGLVVGTASTARAQLDVPVVSVKQFGQFGVEPSRGAKGEVDWVDVQQSEIQQREIQQSEIRQPEIRQPELQQAELQQAEALADLEAPLESMARDPLEIDPVILENSPLLQRWLEEIPDVAAEIRRDPAFRTRVRLGIVDFPSTADGLGLSLGVEDLFLGANPLTVSGSYGQTVEGGDRTHLNTELRAYLLPLGNGINIAPILGYRHLETDAYTTDGLQVGVRLLLIPSRTGAADVSLAQTWVAPGQDEEVGITTLSAGYAVTPDLRLSIDLQQYNAPQDRDNQVGFFLEWMP